jgi:hypothetical protein
MRGDIGKARPFVLLVLCCIATVCFFKGFEIGTMVGLTFISL